MADEQGAEVTIQTEPVAQATEVVIDKAKADKPAQKVITADEGVEDLKAQVAKAKQESERRLGEATRQIEEARRRAVAAEQETAQVRTGAVSTVIDNITMAKDTAKRDYRAAMEAGDYEKAADAQDRLSLANARLVEAEKGKLELEAQAKNPPRQHAQPVVQDNVERLARSMQSERSANWVRSHPEHVQNGELAPAVMSAHYNAVANGIAPDTDDYFDFIDRSVGSPRREVPRQEERQRAPVAAPVGRDVSQAPGAVRPGVIKLTASEVSTAKALDMTLEDYARHKKQLMDEGKIGRVA